MPREPPLCADEGCKKLTLMASCCRPREYYLKESSRHASLHDAVAAGCGYVVRRHDFSHFSIFGQMLACRTMPSPCQRAAIADARPHTHCFRAISIIFSLLPPIISAGSDDFAYRHCRHTMAKKEDVSRRRAKTLAAAWPRRFADHVEPPRATPMPQSRSQSAVILALPASGTPPVTLDISLGRRAS